MKVKLIIISIILLLVMVFACGCIPFMENIGLINPTDEEQLSPEKGGPPDGLVKVLIGFKEKPGAAQQALVKGVGGKIKYTYHIVDAIAASIPEKAIDALQNNPNVTHVELDSMVYALDTELDDSWGVKRIGAGNVHDPPDPISEGFGVKVAIIDTGINCEHEDLNVAGGESFVGYTTEYMDDSGHGTHVAGIIAALNNDIGVVGVAPQASLYALKALDSNGSGYVSDVVMAIQWATVNGIQVINMSLGGGANIWLDGACLLAYYEGLLLVAAAGNSGNPPGKGDNISYPAGYEWVIAVAATDQSDKRASWSSTGSELELSAPGVAINSTLLGGGYGEKSGTSMASPHVAGTAALVWAAYPGWSNVDVRNQLEFTADDLGAAGWDSKYGWGLVDAFAALNWTAVPNNPPVADNQSVIINEDTPVAITLTATDLDSDPLTYFIVSQPLNGSVSGIAPDVSYTPNLNYNGSDSFTFKANDGKVDSNIATVSITINPVNDAPVANPQSVQTPQDTPIAITLTGSDVDNDALTFILAAIPVNGMLTGTVPNLTYAPESGFIGSDNFTFKVNDGPVDSNIATVSITVTPTMTPSNTMHVHNIGMSLKIAGINVNAIAKVTIVDDENSTPVEGATVFGTWSGATEDSDSGITDANGKVSLKSDKVKNPSNGTTFTFTVDDVIKDGYTPLIDVGMSGNITFPQE